MEGVRPETAAARYVAANLKHENFVLLDIGCSGGLDLGWRSFGDRLQAVGFDPSHSEVDRLNGEEANPLVSFHAAFVGVPEGHPLRSQADAASFWGRLVVDRLNCSKTVELRKAVQYGENEWIADAARKADKGIADAIKPVFLPEFLAETGLNSVDFIKIDVDGADYILLQSLNDTLGAAQVLGIGVEVNYFGSDRPSDNVFHNTDRFLRQQQFGLFDLSVRYYSAAALPWRYSLPYPYAAESVRGRAYQGDALYVRDAAADETRPVVDALSAEKIAKLAAIFAIFNLPDQAAEICLAYRDRLATVLDVDVLLDLLALQIQEDTGGTLSFAEYVARFHRDDETFYGGSAGTQLHVARQKLQAAEAALAEREQALSDQAAHEEEVRRLSEALATAQEEAETAKRQLAQVLDSTCWKITAPVRSLAESVRRQR